MNEFFKVDENAITAFGSDLKSHFELRELTQSEVESVTGGGGGAREIGTHIGTRA